MAKGNHVAVDSDNVTLTLSAGGTSVELDVSAETDVYPEMQAHTINKRTSQKYKEQTVVKDGVYGAVSITATFLQSEYDTIEGWWKNATPVTYSVNGATAGLADKSYTECQVRVSGSPKIAPGAYGKVDCTIEVTTLMNLTGTGL